MTDPRELITDKVNFLESLVILRESAKVPEEYDKPIKRTRAVIFGAYKKRLNTRLTGLEICDRWLRKSERDKASKRLKVHNSVEIPEPMLDLSVEAY